MSSTRFWWSCTSCLPQDKQRSFALNDSWKDVISQSDVSLKIQQMKEMVWTFPQRRITNLYFGSKPIYLTCDSKDGSLWCQAIISSWRCDERRECCNQIGHNPVWAVRHHLSCCLFPFILFRKLYFPIWGLSNRLSGIQVSCSVLTELHHAWLPPAIRSLRRFCFYTYLVNHSVHRMWRLPHCMLGYPPWSRGSPPPPGPKAGSPGCRGRHPPDHDFRHPPDQRQASPSEQTPPRSRPPGPEAGTLLTRGKAPPLVTRDPPLNSCLLLNLRVLIFDYDCRPWEFQERELQHYYAEINNINSICG